MKSCIVSFNNGQNQAMLVKTSRIQLPQIEKASHVNVSQLDSLFGANTNLVGNGFTFHSHSHENHMEDHNYQSTTDRYVFKIHIDVVQTYSVRIQLCASILHFTDRILHSWEASVTGSLQMGGFQTGYLDIEKSALYFIWKQVVST